MSGLNAEKWGLLQVVNVRLGDVFGVLPQISAKVQRWRLRFSSCQTMPDTFVSFLQFDRFM